MKRRMSPQYARFFCAALLTVTASAQLKVTTTGGTANNIAKFSGASTIVNSAIFETGGKVGIGTTSPTSTLTINGGLSAGSPSYFGTNVIRLYTGMPDGLTTYTDFRVNPSNGNTALEAKGAGSLFFNYTHGTGGVFFGGGSNSSVGSISNTGNASFNGTGSFLGTGNSFFTGKLGVGTSSPSSQLTVNGVIQSLAGGIKFPDNSVQTSAAVSGLLSVSHDSTLTGNGTGGSPLGISVPLTLSGSTDNTLYVAQLGSDGFAAVYSSDQSGSFSGVGTYGGTDIGTGVYGNADDHEGYGVYGIASGAGGIGVFGDRSGNAQYAGVFQGDVTVIGNVSKSGGSFKIDHPLDPPNKFLSHSFVESPDMKNIYDGNVTTDANGAATVTLPEWFGALNRDFRYQLTTIGQFAQAIVESEIANNRFTIRTDKPLVKVSWQVTGIRQDAWANAHRIPVEEDKTPRERGYYIHPELFNQPADKTILAADHPGKSNSKALASHR